MEDSEVIDNYKGVRIRLGSRQIGESAWVGDYTMVHTNGSGSYARVFRGQTSYATPDEAKWSALKAAKGLVDLESF